MISLENVAKVGTAFELVKQSNGTYANSGELLSAHFVSSFPFDNLVLSWNAEATPNTMLEFQVRVSDGSDFSPWFTMGRWSQSGGSSVAGQSNAWAKVDVDTLLLTRKATAFQYKVNFSTSRPNASPRLRSVSIVYADLSRPLVGPVPELVAGWARDLPVPTYSQLEQDPAVAGEICSPTSLTMVLNYWGQNKTVAEVYRSVRDAQNGIYGNWPLNTAYAAALGLEAYVNRFFSLEQLQNEIAAGRPVIASIRFRPGQLDNAPIPSTSGHLLVVRGFTPQGDVIVNDPIAPNGDSVRRVYKRDQFARVWLDNGGVVYLVRPV